MLRRINSGSSDQKLGGLLAVAAGFSGLILLLIVVFLGKESWPLLAAGDWPALLGDSWYPLEGQFGLMPMLWASLAATVGAIVLATPLGLAGAIFEHFYAPTWLAKGFRLVMALLAGIPSVVYGLWGLTILVPLITQIQPPGTSTPSR